jgi:hypothetical protein
MTADPILVLAWLLLGHLAADFIFQTRGMVLAKTSDGGRAWRGLVAHGATVAVCLVPVPLAFGVDGLWAVALIGVSHVFVDRAKILATRRAEAGALADAARRHEGRAPAEGLGRAWTPMPAALFIADQAAHLVFSWVAWAIFLAGSPLTAGWTSAVDGLLAGRDLDGFHGVVLGAVVVASLLIANVRGGALFVATLVRPIEAASGADEAASTTVTEPGEPAPTAAAAAPAAGAGPTERRRGWSFRIGPIGGRVEPDMPPPPEPAPSRSVGPASVPTPARVGAAIGVLERLLIVTLLLVGADAAIGFVIAAKTIARFRQLDDRDFAEYYLLGTLASVSVAIVTALAARAALGG